MLLYTSPLLKWGLTEKKLLPKFYCAVSLVRWETLHEPNTYVILSCIRFKGEAANEYNWFKTQPNPPPPPPPSQVVLSADRSKAVTWKSCSVCVRACVLVCVCGVGGGVITAMQ